MHQQPTLKGHVFFYYPSVGGRKSNCSFHLRNGGLVSYTYQGIKIEFQYRLIANISHIGFTRLI